jgi:hypothetical protein
MNIENNKIIAEFMGCTNFKMYGNSFTFDHPNKTKWEWSNRFKDNIETNNFSSSSSFYDNDWNWLMEVVEKLKKVTNDDVFLDSLDTSNCRVSIILETELESCFRKSTLEIETVYNTCVEFIKWYNENKFGSVK